jgi:hypothetical protein
MKIMAGYFLIFFCIVFSGCAHKISFHEIDYSIGAQEHDAGLTVVIDSHTLNREVPIKSFMTGIANSWDVQPGQMVKQVADIEIPQMFKDYRFSEVYPEAPPHITLEITIPKYEFANFRATFILRAKAYSADKKVYFDNSYTEVGVSQGAKMFWGGAFAMKSAIRQSSFGALKKIFASLRQDLTNVLLQNKID